MYTVTIRKDIAAAHALRNVGGSCEDLHGHNFRIEVSVAGDRLNREDLLIDFRVLKGWIKEVFAGLDHKNLNDLDAFRDVNPSSERLAKWIYDRLAPRASSLDLRLARITVWESDDARVTYEDHETT